MVINGPNLLANSPIIDMVPSKTSGPGGTSYGLGEAGYDIRIKQRIEFKNGTIIRYSREAADRLNPFGEEEFKGRFVLASAMEEFQMPGVMMGIVHDKSTWARKGLSVFNTVIEPGWCGFLTLELVYHGEEDLVIPAGAGIAQVVFHRVSYPCVYDGKYQNQEDRPVPARESK